MRAKLRTKANGYTLTGSGGVPLARSQVPRRRKKHEGRPARTLREAREREQPKPDVNNETVALVACGIAYALFTRGIRKTTSAIWSDIEVAREFLEREALKSCRKERDR